MMRYANLRCSCEHECVQMEWRSQGDVSDEETERGRDVFPDVRHARLGELGKLDVAA